MSDPQPGWCDICQVQHPVQNMVEHCRETKTNEGVSKWSR